MTNYVISLDDGQALEVAGNKAAALGRVRQLNGIRVPEGYGLSFSALEDSLTEAGQLQAFESLLEVAEAADVAEAAGQTAGHVVRRRSWAGCPRGKEWACGHQPMSSQQTDGRSVTLCIGKPRRAV